VPLQPTALVRATQHALATQQQPSCGALLSPGHSVSASTRPPTCSPQEGLTPLRSWGYFSLRGWPRVRFPSPAGTRGVCRMIVSVISPARIDGSTRMMGAHRDRAPTHGPHPWAAVAAQRRDSPPGAATQDARCALRTSGLAATWLRPIERLRQRCLHGDDAAADSARLVGWSG